MTFFVTRDDHDENNDMFSKEIWMVKYVLVLLTVKYINDTKRSQLCIDGTVPIEDNDIAGILKPHDQKETTESNSQIKCKIEIEARGK